MLPIDKNLQLVLLGMACSIAIAIGINTLLARLPKKWDVTGGFDLYFYNLCFKPSLRPHPRLMVIDSNDPTERRPRSDYARMVNKLRLAGAKCIALDIRFLAEYPEDPQGDQALVDSVAAAPQVILAMDFASARHPPADLRAKAERLALPDSLCEVPIPKIVAEQGVDLPFHRLLEVTPHLGHINAASGQYYHFPPYLDRIADQLPTGALSPLGFAGFHQQPALAQFSHRNFRAVLSDFFQHGDLLRRLIAVFVRGAAAG